MPPAKPWPFEIADHVDAVAGSQSSATVTVCAGLDALDVVAKLAHEARRLDALLLKMPGKGTGDAVALDASPKPKSDGVVAVLLLRPAFHDRAGTGFDHRDRHVSPVVGEHARHPNLAAKDVLHLVLVL